MFDKRSTFARNRTLSLSPLLFSTPRNSLLSASLKLIYRAAPILQVYYGDT